MHAGYNPAVGADLKDRIEQGVAELRARFADRMKATPSLSDPMPQGEGPRNRHGMPRLPPGQNEFDKQEWPVLDLGQLPAVAPDRWRLTIDGAVDAPLSLGWGELLDLPQVDLDADFHCVTGWSVLDLALRGVRFETVAALARPRADATHVMTHASDGYSTNLPLEEALKPDVLLVHGVEGKPLAPEHGGPVRVVVPQLWAWKGAKWLSRIEFLTHDRRGYWEIRGYSNTGYPWRDDRMW
ncbi:MAG TPA: molybdopterin-dependent oxidoreductase [Anaeromyxobacteraceae bacterium]|nr:molybdopterin-dependent oxidoreductase [Anaeromyxobacteraceae bacterium]